MAFKTGWLEKPWWNETGRCPASLKSARGCHAERGINWQGVWLRDVGLSPNFGDIWPVFSGQFQWRWGIWQPRRTRKIFTLQQTKDVLTAQHISVGWGEHSLLSYLQKHTCSASRHHHTSQRGSELTASQGIHTEKRWFYFPDQKAVSGMTVNNQLPKAYLQLLQLK